MDRLLNVTAGLSAILFVVVLVSVRRAHIRVEYSISWLAGCAAMFALSRARHLLDGVRDALGLPDSPLVLFLAGSSVLLIMFYRHSVIVSHLRDDNIALAQRIAILEFRLRSIESSHEQ